jgi:hypothetical protein
MEALKASLAKGKAAEKKEARQAGTARQEEGRGGR